MELSDVPIPGTLDDDALAALARALGPVAADPRAAARAVREPLARLLAVEAEVRQTIDEATGTMAEVVDHTLPPYWPFLLGGAVALTASGLLTLWRPDLRLHFAAGVGLLLALGGGHYAARAWRRARRVRPLQARFERLEARSRALFEEAAALEQALAAQGFSLQAPSFLPFGPTLATLWGDDPSAGPAVARLTERMTLVVTGAAERHCAPDAEVRGSD